ncbi:MAG: hypothetical protein NC548_65230 [Lachnospiraceae bacterium]|nr:hypothetical protein [Lachnospiraceae bacterium]
MKTYTITQENLNALIEMGANRWTKGGHDRLYLSGCGDKLIGLECDYYKSGNVSCATLNGEKISNAEVFRVRNTYDRAYIDLKDGGICGISRESKYHDSFLEKINAFRIPNEG